MNLLEVSQMPGGEGPLLRHYAINTESRCEIGTLVHKDYNRGAVWSANIPNSPGYQLSVRDHAAVWCWPAAGHVSTDSVVTEPLQSLQSPVSGLWTRNLRSHTPGPRTQGTHRCLHILNTSSHTHKPHSRQAETCVYRICRTAVVTSLATSYLVYNLFDVSVAKLCDG